MLQKYHGAVAQLGERRVRNAKVRGSIPLGSTNTTNWLQKIVFPANSIQPLHYVLRTRLTRHSPTSKPITSQYPPAALVPAAPT